MDLIDLHVHTNISDGSFSPEEVVRYAIKKGLKAIAITDHDSMEGNERAKKEGDLIGLEVISGVEISAEFSYGTLHILGYFPWDSNNNMKERLIVLQKAREERNPLIVKKLQALGIQIEFDEVKKIAGYGQIGRPHFAKLLVEKGIVKDMDEAFDRFLKKGGPAYVDKFRFSPKQSINEIKKNKGIPVLAHPFTIDLDNDKLIKKIEELSRTYFRTKDVLYKNSKEI